MGAGGKKSKPSKRNHSNRNDLHTDTRDRLIQAAKTLFANKGFDGTTVKDISDAAGVNVSLVSYHFDGKDGLYRSCLEQLGKTRLAMTERILQPPQNLGEFKIRLQIYLEELLNGYLDEPEISQIMTRECQSQFKNMMGIFKNTFLKIYENLQRFFEEAQKKGIIRSDLNVEIATRLLFGGLIHMAQKDELNELLFGTTIRNPQYKEYVIQNVLSFALKGMISDSQSVNQPIYEDRYEAKSI